MARLFLCHDCKTMELIPDYEGPLELAEVPGPDGNLVEREVPPVGADSVLDYVTAPHSRQEHVGQLVSIEDKYAANEKILKTVLDQIRASLTGGLTGLDPEAYALRSTLHEDAMKCFNAHKRPKNGCIDWHDKSKRIGNSLLTGEERREAKREGLPVNQKQFLCDYCPVASQVQQKKFKKEGHYDR